jgi:hypothetical protein
VANSEAVLAVATGKAFTNCYIADNVCYRLNTAGDLWCDNDVTTNSGIVINNHFGHADTETEVLFDLDGVRLFNNTGTALDTAQGYPLPAIDS